MIVLNLKCASDHAFEGWFASSEAFDEQLVRHLVACPICATTEVVRLPSGPRIKRSAEVATERQPVMSMPAELVKAFAHMVAQAENVDERFPEEARRIHYGEAPARSIRGKASQEETEELMEEGIMVMPVPFPAKEDTH